MCCIAIAFFLYISIAKAQNNRLIIKDRISYFVEHYPNRQIYAEIPVDESGNASGIRKVYYMDGSIQTEMNFKNNKKEGKSVDYAPNGQIISTVMYQNDMVVSGTVLDTKTGKQKVLTQEELQKFTTEQLMSLGLSL